ncbi:methylated-DNA--[protein]-cysteine S-methyltransferase [Planctomonas sp. JC2975]|uniref:methylated-DNA--[protein]-cysteine S-methyltransferase n=1 Tax=Planctomonas sp. JC2975 TaxID=2729626 RepID=UPI0014733936|nr:methylated-DNA--[protein]-cysteine S-methyltransferase [Planctomonas sp. JC2975]NNC13208.1 methylated-DNA--[protein]-cysteine S-methyltransferase [Planctomonas sp. JC2975]
MDAYLLCIPSPIGRLELVSDGSSVTCLTIEREGRLPLDGCPDQPDDVLRDAAIELDQYFAGERQAFDVPLNPHGTEFRKAVWTRLLEVPWGEHTTYGELGMAVGKATAGRAVGGAIGANPIPLLIGCHRVLGSDGRITGYSGGAGIPTKLWLLQHEGITLAA